MANDIQLAEIKSMLVAPTVPAHILDREATQLAKLAQEQGLTAETTEMVAYIRREHHGQLATVGHYLAKDYSVEQIVCAYEARDLFDANRLCKGQPSIGAILEAADYFADSEDAEHFQELLLELPALYPHLDYSDTIVKVALEEARERGIVYLGDFIERRS